MIRHLSNRISDGAEIGAKVYMIFMKSVISVFFTNTVFLSDEIQQYLLDMLPIVQKSKAFLIKNKKKRKDFIIGRTLLIYALQKKYSFSKFPTILEQPDDAPSIEGADDIYLSISHSVDMICCVVYGKPIGIDIEYKQDRQNLIDKSIFFMSFEELEALKKIPAEEGQKEHFYQVWCAKEAIFKALDRFTQSKTTLLSIKLSRFFSRGDWSLFQKEIDNYQLSLVYDGEEQQIQLISVDLNRSLGSVRLSQIIRTKSQLA